MSVCSLMGDDGEGERLVKKNSSAVSVISSADDQHRFVWQRNHSNLH